MRVPMSRRVLLRAATAACLLLGLKARARTDSRGAAPPILHPRGGKPDADAALFARYGGELGGSRPKNPG